MGETPENSRKKSRALSGVWLGACSLILVGTDYGDGQDHDTCHHGHTKANVQVRVLLPLCARVAATRPVRARAAFNTHIQM